MTEDENAQLHPVKKIVIAIDGPSASGKSTIAKALAKSLHYAYVDSGAMYRAVTLFFLENHIEIDNLEAVKNALSHISIRFIRNENGNNTLLNERNVESEIRQMRVSEYVSQVAAIAEVRKAMVKQQQEMGKDKGLVMDGRDIGTVVFPDAELKIFVTSDVEQRARRRYEELLKKGQSVTLGEVLENLRERDHIDSNRAIGPLRKAEDAFEIDNTRLSPEEQLSLAIKMVETKIGEKVQ
ncbi:MAG: (d)CMP kinase [Saprospiraceae bacterium]|nr:(d)CMP kinase [Saprospiraceae bacterium]